jgi:hypothetical protein
MSHTSSRLPRDEYSSSHGGEISLLVCAQHVDRPNETGALPAKDDLSMALLTKNGRPAIDKSVVGPLLLPQLPTL